MTQRFSVKDSLLNDKEVLIIEDSSLNRQIITKILRRNNIKSVAAASGEEALTVLKKNIQRQKSFALVLLDIMLPGSIDGFEVAEYIKNDPCLNSTEIIVISKSQKMSEKERFRQIGVSRFYPKPLSEKDLMDCIRDVLLINQSKPCKNNSEVPADEIVLLNENSKHNILLVEDNRVNQEITSGMLTKRGHKVTIAENGKEAVEYFTKDSFDIILMDIQMPEKNGYEATQVIRELERFSRQHTYIIGFTANAMQGDREKCLEAGMDDYISKPVHLRELINGLERYRQNKSLVKDEPDKVTACKPKINLQRLFNDLDRDQHEMDKILSLFEDDVLRVLKDIELAVKTGRMAEASAFLHTLRGQCGLIDMNSVNEIAQELEVLTGNNQPSKVEQLLPKLSRELRESLNEIQLIRIS